MLTLTPQASRTVARYFQGKTISPIRIFYSEGG